jgi:hypothetical protein
MQYLLPPIMAALGSLLVAALAFAVQWLKQKAQDSKAARVGLVFGELAHSIVAHLDVEMKPKVAKAWEDGTLTPEEGALLKAEAMRILKEKAPAELLKAAKDLFGAATDGWLSGLIERAVSSKPESTAVAAPIVAAVAVPRAETTVVPPTPLASP